MEYDYNVESSQKQLYIGELHESKRIEAFFSGFSNVALQKIAQSIGIMYSSYQENYDLEERLKLLLSVSASIIAQDSSSTPNSVTDFFNALFSFELIGAMNSRREINKQYWTLLINASEESHNIIEKM